MGMQILYYLLLIVSLTFNSCCKLFGSYDLGSSFYMLSGNKDNEEIIIYCSPNRESDCCNGGPQIIPSMEDYYNGDYVENAKFDNRWIIILVVNEINNNKSYWIIDKNFELEEKYKNWPLSKEDGEIFYEIIQSHMYGPFSYDAFTKKKEELGVKLFF